MISSFIRFYFGSVSSSSSSSSSSCNSCNSIETKDEFELSLMLVDDPNISSRDNTHHIHHEYSTVLNIHSSTVLKPTSCSSTTASEFDRDRVRAMIIRLTIQ